MIPYETDARSLAVFTGSAAPDYDGQIGNPVSAIATIVSLSQQVFGGPTPLLSLFSNPAKDAYNTLNPRAQDAARAYPGDVVGAAQILGVDPVLTAQALSEYLRDDKKINISRDQILAASPTVAAMSKSAIPSWVIPAGVGLAALYLLR